MSVKVGVESPMLSGQETQACNSSRQEAICFKVLIGGILLYSITFSIYCCRHLDQFGFAGFDLSIFSQASWLIAEGETPFSTVRGVHILGDHFSAILYIFAPLCWLSNSPKALLTAQAVAVSAGALPVYGIGLRTIRSAPIAMVFAISYLLNPSVQGYTLEEFHPDSLATPLLLGAIYFLLAARWRGFFICLVLAALIKETAALAIIPLGVYAVFIARWKGVIAILLGIVALAIAQGTMRHFSGEHSSPYTASLYGRYGRSPLEVTTAILKRPYILAEAASTELGPTYLADLLEPIGYLPLLSPGTAAVAVPTVAANLLGKRPSFRRAELWYSAPISPMLFAAAILGFARCHRWRIRAVTGILMLNLCIASLLAFSTSLAAGPAVLSSSHFTASQARDARLVVDKIPPNASVSAPTVLLPTLSERREVYVFPNPFYRVFWGATEQALAQQEGLSYSAWSDHAYDKSMDRAPVEYVVLGPQPYVVIPPSIYDALCEAQLACPRYGIIAIHGAHVLLRRAADHSAGLAQLESASGLSVDDRADLMLAYNRLRERDAPLNPLQRARGI